MSLQTVNSVEPHKKSKDKSSKKRKHEGGAAETPSNKKIKQAIKLEEAETKEADMSEVQSKLDRKEKKEKSEKKTGVSQQRPEPEAQDPSEKEQKRKKKHKHKDQDDLAVLVTLSTQPDQDIDLPDAPPQEEVQQTDLAQSPQPEKKPKKKKGSKEKEAPPQPVTTGNINHQDIELPDVPLHVEPQPTDPAQSEEPEKKRKKPKKPKKPEEQAQPTTNDTTPIEEIELPEAPIVETEQPSVSTPPDEPEVETGAAVEDTLQIEEQSLGVDFLNSAEPSCFYSTKVSLYLPIPAITLPEHARKSVLSMHVSPLLLTYFAPVKGIVVAFQDPVFSAEPSGELNFSLQKPAQKNARTEEDWKAMTEILALSSDQFGAAYVWLTVTLLVFRPLKGDEMYGWNNIASEGFVGIVSYNYFQTAVGASRIPSGWRWKAPMNEQRRKRKGRTEKMLENGRRSQCSPMLSSSTAADEQSRKEIEDETGFWDEHGQKVAETLKYRVVDTDMVPGGEKGKWSMHIDGTLLPAHEEEEMVLEEKEKWERMREGQSGTPGVQMSGGLG